MGGVCEFSQSLNLNLNKAAVINIMYVLIIYVRKCIHVDMVHIIMCGRTHSLTYRTYIYKNDDVIAKKRVVIYKHTDPKIHELQISNGRTGNHI